MPITFLDTKSEKRGFGFGVNSGVITVLGVIMGLYSSTASMIVIISAILSVAIADSFSDALGIHVSEESVTKNHEHAWSAALYTFLSKLLITLSFLLPFILLQIDLAVLVSIIYGLSITIVYNYYLALTNKVKPYLKIIEHLSVSLIVLAATYYVGHLISLFF